MSDFGLTIDTQKTKAKSSFETSSAFADAVQRARQLEDRNKNQEICMLSWLMKAYKSLDSYSYLQAVFELAVRGHQLINRFLAASKWDLIAAKIHTSGSETNSLGGGTKRPLDDSMDHLTDESPDVKKMASVNDAYGVPLSNVQRTGGGPVVNAIMVEEWKVPDKMVGLIIGRGGEQIIRLQAESGCKIQMATESTGAPDRPCTLTGTKQAIDKAKELVSQIVARGSMSFSSSDPNHIPDGQIIVEILIPAGKVGLVIGKGGDTIRKLQEQAQVKMVMIQDGPQQTGLDKPLRITGEAEKCEFAKQMVMDLITEKELETIQGYQQSTNEYGSVNADGSQEPNFDSNDNYYQRKGRNKSIRGKPGAGRGRGRGRGRGGDNSQSNKPGNENKQEIHHPVPVNKCGLIIGKGGETIRSINQQTGAHVELSRGQPPNPYEKMFIIRGNPQQIEHARNIINERIGAPPVSNGHGPFPPPGPQPYTQQVPPPPAQQIAQPAWNNNYQSWQAPAPVPNDPSKVATDANAAAWAAYYAQYYNQQTPQPPQPQPTIQTQPQPIQQVQQPQPQTQAPAASTGQPDYSAAWIEYYRSIGMYKEAEAIEQQARMNQPQMLQPQAPATMPVPTPVPAPAPGPIPTSAPTHQPQTPVMPAGQPPPAAIPPPQVQQNYPPTSAVPPAQWGAPAPYQSIPNPYPQQNPYPNYSYNAYPNPQ